MIDKELIDSILLQLKTELEHHNNFIEKLKGINSELDKKGCPPLYSVQQLTTAGEQYIHSIRKAIADLPLEELID